MLRKISIALAVSSMFLMAQSAGGIKWTPPKRWTVAPAATSMRAATYKIPVAAGDTDPGECGVFFFGSGQGGSVEANLARWSGQFQSAGGQPLNPKIEKTTTNGLKVSTIDVSGTYTATGGPMMAAQAPKQGYRMIAAVVEGKQGSVFFKFTGPKKTVAAGEAEFQTMLKTIKSE